jgi:hypothetical protein
MVNNTLIDDPTEIANKFNNFFTSIASEISSKINPCPVNNPVTAPDCVFNMSNIPISQAELTNAINELQSKKSTDLNGISMHI